MRLRNSWYLAAAVAASVAVAGPAAAGPVPPTAPADYYPLRAGTKWHYKGTATVTAENGKRTTQPVAFTFVLREFETIDGVKLARIDTELGGKVAATEHLAATEKGLFRHRFNGIKSVPPFCLVRYPVTDGDTWEAAFTAGKETAKLTATLTREAVEVPAGKYKTVKVVMNGETNDTAISTTYWFADRVGIVKQEYAIGLVQVAIELEKVEMPEAKK